MNPNLKLDIFPHIFPQAFFERVKAIAEQSPALAAQIKRWLHIPVLWDLEARLRMMGRFPGYKQILTLSLPANEFLAPHEQSPELARLANDYDLPVWVHPTRTAKFADYVSDSKSKYEIYWLFGWPYETSVFMARLV